MMGRKIAGERIAAIEMPPYAPIGQELVRDGTACVRGKLSNEREWFATTPVVISLVDGIVTKAVEGEQAVREAGQ